MRYEDVQQKVKTAFGQPLDLHYMNNEVQSIFISVQKNATISLDDASFFHPKLCAFKFNF